MGRRRRGLGRDPAGDMKAPPAASSASSSSVPISSSIAASNSIHQEVGRAGLDTDGEMAASISTLEALLGYTFRDRLLAEEALTHPSIPPPTGKRRFSNGRLAFLGDAVLGLAVANHLYVTYPDAPRGELAPIRSANVSTEKFARVALRHGLYGCLRRSALPLDDQVTEFAAEVQGEEDQDAQIAAFYGGVSLKAPKVLADVVESVAAAVFLDSGSDISQLWRVYRRLLEPIINPNTFLEQPVSTLHRLCQKRGWSLVFLSCQGSHTTVQAIVNGELLCVASSNQKQLAKLNAARQALEKLCPATPKAQDTEMMEVEISGGIDQDTYTWEEEHLSEAINGGHDAVDGGGEPMDEMEKDEGENNSVVVNSEPPEEVEIEEAKMKLQNICGKKHWTNPVYSTDREMGPPHDRKFICSVQVQTPEQLFKESGDMRSMKKDAEHAAASKLIKALMRVPLQSSS